MVAFFSCYVSCGSLDRSVPNLESCTARVFGECPTQGKG